MEASGRVLTWPSLKTTLVWLECRGSSTVDQSINSDVVTTARRDGGKRSHQVSVWPPDWAYGSEGAPGPSEWPPSPKTTVSAGAPIAASDLPPPHHCHISFQSQVPLAPVGVALVRYR